MSLNDGYVCGRQTIFLQNYRRDLLIAVISLAF